MDTPDTAIPRGRIAILGVTTIAVYGAWIYSFGVLLDPIITDTGWSEGALATTYAASGAITGIGSILGGWLMDRVGSRPVFAAAAVVAAVAFAVAAAAPSLVAFGISGAIGGGVIGALGFYHITQTAAVRISPFSPQRAIAVLTIWGAFSSAIYLPAAAWLVEWIGWRDTLRVLAVSAVVALVVATVGIGAPGADEARVGMIFAEVRSALHRPSVWRFVLATAFTGMAASVVFVYQVPTMTAAGLPLTTASFMAGFRGFAQLGGRVPLGPILKRLGTPRSMQLALVAMAVGTGLLAVSGSIIIAALYALVAGFGIGAMSPLQGIYAQELFGGASLGTAMGLLTLVFGVVGSVGPALAGWIAESTGSRAWPVAGAALAALVAALMIRPSTGDAPGAA